MEKDDGLLVIVTTFSPNGPWQKVPKPQLPLRDSNMFLLGGRRAGISGPPPSRDLRTPEADSKNADLRGPPQRFCFSLGVEPQNLHVK